MHASGMSGAGLCLAAAALAAGAQDPGTLSGTVRGIHEAPLADARVAVAGTPLRLTTDASGFFRLRGVPAGRSTLLVSMPGYTPASMIVEIAPGEAMHLRVQLHREATVLQAVEVVADTLVTPGMQGFRDRLERGNGRFFTRDDIVRMQPRLFTDILRRVAGVQVQSGIDRYGSGAAVQIGRNSGGLGSRVCPVEFFVNGSPFPLARDGGINHFIPPEEVVGVEVYAGAAQVPPQFSSAMYNTRCGVVVIWTRSGPDAAPNPG